MTATSYSRTPYLIVHREQQARKEVYGSIDDMVVLQAQHLRGERDSQTVFVGMHPIGSPGYLPMFNQLARAGHHVVACATRYSTGDGGLIMENVLLDLAACVRDARERLGYERVVLVGWSGGGSLMAGYQAEAERPVITETAAREPTPLAGAALPPGDALLLIATHRSRHQLLTGQLDASITNENNADEHDPALDLYDPQNPNHPPFGADFLTRYREAQIARSRRISEWALDQLEWLRGKGRQDEERCFTVHGTMADPRWLDGSIEPSDRTVGSTYLGDPRIVNNSAIGLARFTSCRSWLSQWSFDHAQVDTVDAGPRITVPFMIITATADNACPPSHTRDIYSAVRSADKTKHDIVGANHYFTGEHGREHLAQTMSLVGTWAGERGLTE